MRKAFDSVNHSILIKKLNHYGFRGIVNDWFQNYLEDRKQFVSIGDIDSDSQIIRYGVPQGSVLGPILFLLYINDLQNSSKILDFHLFADDTNLFYASKSLQDLEHTMNNELINIQNWLNANKLALNVDKSSFLIFHPPQKKLPYRIKLSINGRSFKYDKSIKYLGIMFDSHLKWKEHVKLVSNKVKRGIGIISKTRLFVSESILNNLYYTLMYPFFNYGTTAWGNTNPSTTQPLLLLQKRALRLITFSGYREHTNPLFIKFEILKFHDLVKYNNALFVFNFHSGKLPEVFNNFFPPVNLQHNYRTRLASKSSFSLPKARTNYGKFSIRFAGTQICNSVDESIKETTSISNFKIQMKQFLINLYYM